MKSEESENCGDEQSEAQEQQCLAFKRPVTEQALEQFKPPSMVEDYLGRLVIGAADAR